MNIYIKNVNLLVLIVFITSIFLESAFNSTGLCSSGYLVNQNLKGEKQDKKKKEIESVAINQLNQASRKFKEKKYKESAIDLIIIMDYYSEFSKLDEVIYLLGSCLYEMELFEGADLIYRYLIKTYPKTELLPDAVLGLQKVNYQKKEYNQSLKFYQALEGHYTTHKGIDESRYYAGQAYYHLKNYVIVSNIIEQIKKGSEFYAFRLYTGGLVYLKKKNIKKSLENFIEITKISSKQPDVQNLINAARLTLGYIFFELSNYESSIKYLEGISSDFYDFPEALLTKGWSAFKLQNYQAAINTLNSLINDHSDFYNTIEAHFLLGQCYMKLGYYDFSIKEFSKIVDTFPNSEEFMNILDKTNLEINEQEYRVENLKTELLVLETNFLDFVSKEPGNGVPDDIVVEHKRVQKMNQDLVEKILYESNIINDAYKVIGELKTKLEKLKMHKNWQSHAEYGRARALYLKGIE